MQTEPYHRAAENARRDDRKRKARSETIESIENACDNWAYRIPNIGRKIADPDKGAILTMIDIMRLKRVACRECEEVVAYRDDPPDQYQPPDRR